jgi:hypothetical protein
MFSFRSRDGVGFEAMSIHIVTRVSGAKRYVVRYRDPDGVNRSRAFSTRRDAERYQREIADAKAKRRERELRGDVERF